MRMRVLPVRDHSLAQELADAGHSDEDTCKGQGDLVLHRGPKLEESRFTEEEKPKWVLCQQMQG